MNARDLLVLAEAYARASNRSLATVGRRACGNDGLFLRLAAGRGCNTRTLDKAAAWFAANWPPDQPWPLESQPPCSACREAAE